MSQDKLAQGYSAKDKESSGEDLYESDDFLKNIVDNSSDAIITKDLKGIIRSWNKGAEKIFGYSAQEMIGESMLRLIPEDLLYEEEVFLKTIASGKSIDHFQARRIHKDGRIIHVSISLSPIRNSKGIIFGISKIARDVSKEFELLESLKLVKSAVENSTDAIITKDLNGIISGWNKGAENIFGYSAQEMIGASMLRLFPPNRELEEALILEKISSGKRVDTFQTERIHKDGHIIHLSVTISPIFDSRGVVRLMIEVARRLSASMREADSLARVGSDEFVGYLSGMENSVEFEVLMERLMRNLSAPYAIENKSVQITGSIGVRFFACGDVQNIELLVRQADQAMIAAKQSGKHRYKVFDPARDLETKQRLASLDDISSGIARNEFFMKYQPKVNLKSGEMTGVEALVRWNHPSKGVLTPVDFLPGLIDTKLKIEFTENVIKMVFAQSVAWAKEGLVPVVSINVYINQLQDTFFDFIKIQMAQFPNLNPRNIEFELLETDALLDTAKAIYIMEELHALGFSFSIDDFGTGYSSLTYLRKLPFDTIKIDQGFVLNEGLAEKNVDIVRAIIELAKIFDRHVIAEGIETVEIGTRLIELGCLYGQGYAIAKPMEAKEIIKWHELWRAPEVWLTAITPTLNPS